MKRIRWLGLIIAALAALLAIVFFVVAPILARNAAEKNDQFRAAHQVEHDAIDARFHQKDQRVNGLQWHYVEEGSPKGTPILFLHGLPEGWYSWSKVLPLVDPQYRLIAIDMKGYGRSDRTDSDYNWHTVASQTLDFMTSLGIQKFYLVGHDWGTLIGSTLVSDHPERLLGFVRMEADLVPKNTDNLLANYLQKPQWLLFQSPWIASTFMQDAGAWIDFVYASRMATPFQPADRDYLVYEYARPGVASAVPNYFLRSNWDLDAAIAKICQNNFPFPVLQLQADSDPSQPKAIFADAATRCPNVKIEWVTNANHFDNFDQPQQVADAINRFVHSAGK